MEILFFAVAFVCGFVLLQFRLPPLIGFLLAGFVLNLAGYQMTPTLETLANLGVTLLLFSIGLKLKLNSLVQPYVWFPASSHMLLSSLMIAAFCVLLASFGMALFADITMTTALLLGFALSFSSTVFAVKVFEERGEMATLHGRTAIGILVMQDIFAVIFLAVSTGKVPNGYAPLLLVGLLLLRPVMFWVLGRSKHGELMPLFGFFFALIVGYQCFELVGLKGDLGALIIGMLLAPHKKAGELSKALLNLKDFLLVGFFLSIGLSASLSTDALIAACVLLLVLPLKTALYYFLINCTKVRARTNLLASFSLSNYSEFGLIVCAVATAQGWLSSEWLAVVAIVVAMTFVLASPLNSRANELYSRFEPWLIKWQTKKRLAEEAPVDLRQAKILVFGMGRIGTGAYETIAIDMPGLVAGVDIKSEVVNRHTKRGRFVLHADATDPDFWQRINHSNVELVMLAMPKHNQNMYALEQLNASGFDGQVTAIANYPDQEKELRELGVETTYNFYQEAGSGFAEHVKQALFQK